MVVILYFLICFGFMICGFLWIEHLFTTSWWVSKFPTYKVSKQQMCAYLQVAYQHNLIDKATNFFGVMCYIPKEDKGEEVMALISTRLLDHKIKHEITRKEEE
jgi:hypothetical protein